MVVQRFYDEGLAHASYLVGCPGAGEAVVIDANRDFDQYIDAAASQGMRITKVTETHIHADYLSGSRELADLTGAKLYLSSEGGPDWQYQFSGNIELVSDGSEFSVGSVSIRVMHTPGHTPEHIAFIVTDTLVSVQPAMAFTGDFLFVGDVGRPDLLENAAGLVGTAEPGAATLFHSIQRFRQLPDNMLVWPAHGAGSPCGRSLGGVPVSTLGYEKATNWAFQIGTEQEFVTEVLTGQPEPPVYYAKMKEFNKVGPAFISDKRRLVETSRVERFIGPDTVVLDVRNSAEYLDRHIVGSHHAPVGKNFAIYAGWFVPYDKDILMIADDRASAAKAERDLSLIGLDRVIGFARPDVFDQLEAVGIKTTRVRSVRAEEIHLNGETVLDVRGSSEWVEGHLESAIHIPYGYIPRQGAKLDQNARYCVHCRSGARSPVAISALERMGVTDLVNVSDGYEGIVAHQKSPALA